MKSLNQNFAEGGFDNNVRPYTRGFIQREESIATIVLYTGSQSISSAPTKDVEYTASNSVEKVDNASPRTNVNTDKGIVNSAPTQVVTLENESQGLYFGVFNNFSLIEVMESKDSIVKLHQNFGSSWNLFFFGNSPSAYTFRGIFLDTFDYPYYQEFMTMYTNYLEGRKCVERGWKMKIAYDGKVVGGYLINIKTSISAEQPHTKAFSFTVIITDENFFRNNAVVNGTEFTGTGEFNQMNNGHRVISQYPGLALTPSQTVSITDGQSEAAKMTGKSQQNSLTNTQARLMADRATTVLSQGTQR